MSDQRKLKAFLVEQRGYIKATERRDNCAGCTYFARYPCSDAVCTKHQHTRVGGGGICGDYTARPALVPARSAA